MPHRVANFLRTSSGNIAQIKKVAGSLNTSRANSRNNSRNNSRANSRANSRNNSPYVSDAEEPQSAKSPDLESKKHHRIGLPFGKSSKENHNNGPVTLNWNVESPPIILHGKPEESTGALINGQMFLEVREDIEIDSFKASLRMHTVQKRPFQNHCNDCQHQYIEVKEWQFLSQPMTMTKGRHAFPFSSLIAGNLPASVDTPVVSISYDFKAVATYAGRPPVHFERPVVIKRSLPEPDLPHHSVRVFPPTNIKASAHYSSVIHPTGTNNVSLRLDGLMSRNEKAKAIDFWRLKKLTWRLEETIKTTAPACTRHTHADADKKNVARTETRVLGEKHLHDGWKSDFTGSDGTVDMEFDYQINQFKSHTREPKFACDTTTDEGIEISHSLLIELVVSREYAPEGKPQLATQTGTGRILRMHYSVIMTDHAGMGVSWDNEAPPVYQDVPPSPPAYPCIASPTYESLEHLEAHRLSVEPLDLGANGIDGN